MRNKHRFITQALQSLEKVALHNSRALFARRGDLQHHLAPFLDQLWSLLVAVFQHGFADANTLQLADQILPGDKVLQVRESRGRKGGDSTGRS